MISVENLTKKFNPIIAVDGISFQVKKGEVLGFLGPNDAGKSTTMKMLTCFLSPTEGNATVAGHSIIDDPIEVRKKMGYMPENAPLYNEMEVEDFLEYVAELRGIDKAERKESVAKVLETCALVGVKAQMIDTLSKGYKRRVSLAQALIHDPEILILDEPTDGLDPNQKHDVRQLIKKLVEKKCIIFSTHILEEVEAVCTRAIIIAKGKILFDGTPTELKRKSDSGKMDDVFRAITTGEKVRGVSL